MSITRRQAIKIGGIAAVSALSYGGYRYLVGRKNQDLDHLDHLYPFIQPTVRWTSLELTAFLEHLNSDEQKLILGSVGKPNDTFNVAAIKAQVVWLASNVVIYPFRDKTDCNYHEYILQWLASEYDVEKRYQLAAPSFVLERRILDSIFVQIWDKLTPVQRRQILDSIDKEGAIKDKAGIALAGGAAALAALSATVFFAGFAFYTSMSIVICATAGFFGVAVPGGFAAYAGASYTAGVLSGPVGWAILGLAALGSVAIFGRANATKTAAFVTQMHLLKVQSLENSHRLERVLAELALK
jgi:hypothetical protein